MDVPENIVENTLTPIQMLDKVLEWFSMDVQEMGLGEQLSPRQYAKKDVALRLMADKFKELNTAVFLIDNPLILSKLVKDGYLRLYYDDLYSITFDGKYFSRAGGYKQKIINESAENTRLERLETNQRRNQIAVIWLTGVLAFGALIAAIYYLTELYWKYHWFH